MPRYFFHTEDGTAHADEEGVELASEATARLEGVRFLGQMLGDDPRALWRDGHFTLTITDGFGQLVALLQLSVSRPSNVVSLRTITPEG